MLKKAARFLPLAVLAFPLLLLAKGAGAVDSSVIDVPVLQKLLSKRGSTWRAGENRLTRMPREQLQRMLGLRNPPNPDIQFAAPYREVPRSAAKTLDWRSKDGVNWVSPILNQGNCGSCVAFSSVGNLETQVNITSGIPGLNPSFSTQALFACGGGGCDSGWWPDDAAQYMKTSGVPDEACAPYTMGATGVDVSCGTICSDSAERSLKLVDYSTPTSGTKNITAVKKALEHGPLVTAFTVYADFVAYHGGVYKHVTGDVLGGHAVSIVGYDDNARAWIVRNSWGPDWGESGFFRISWDDDSGLSEQTWSYTVPSAQGYVSVRTPHGRVFASGHLALEAESTFPNTKSLKVTIVGDADSGVSSAPIDAFACSPSSGATSSPTDCRGDFDTTSLANGRYDVYATASWGNGSVTVSQHEQLFVFNGQAHLSLTATPESGTDLTKPVSGRIVFDLKSSTGTNVPLTSITLHVNQGGHDVATKSTSLVVPEMTLGWRSNPVPDGEYDIWFTGHLTTSSTDSIVETPHVHITVNNSSGR